VNSLIEKYRDAPIIADPWPHIVIDNFVPDAIYKFILKVFEEDKTAPDNLDDPHYPYGEVKAPEKILSHNNWTVLTKYFKNNVMKETVLDKWNIKHGEEILVKNGVHRDHKHFFQDPHNDLKDYAKKGCLVTMQLYCPPDESLKDLGTTLWETGPMPHDVNDREGVAKTLDFMPNRCISFKCIEEGWHGVFPIKRNTNYNRNSLRLLYYVSV
jgi:hypothetical protein